MAIFRRIPEGDLALTPAGDFEWIAGIRHRRQQISTRFRFFLGEWFLNRLLGVPYFRDVFVKNPNMDVIRSVFLGVLKACPGVLTVERFFVAYDRRARQLSFAFSVITNAGVLTVAQTDRDFLIAA